MARPKPTAPKPARPMTAQEQERLAFLRAELESRLNRLRANINAKRRARGMIEIEDGVWIMPDQQDTQTPSPNLIVVNPPPLR